MAKEATVAAPQRAAKTTREPQRIATASMSGVHDSTSAVEHMQRTAGNAAVTEHIEAGGLDPRNDIAASAVRESAGRPLDQGAQRMMAAYLDHDLSQVRVHDDARSLEALEPLNAEAFALGQHIVVPRIALDATSPRGQALLAHEVVHTVQQSRGAGGAAETSAHEGEAHGIGSAVGAGRGAGAATAVAAGTAGVGVARQPKEKESQSFHEVALQANRYWSTRISGWPGDDALRELWTAKKFDEFADAVRDYQRAHGNAKGVKTDGVVDQSTMTALKANPIAKPKAEKKDAGEKAATPISEKAPTDATAPAKPSAAAPATSTAGPPSGRHRFDGALGLLKEARRESLAGNQEKAQLILQLIDEKFLATFRYDDSAIWKTFPNMNGVTITQTIMLVQSATSAIHSLRARYRLGSAPTEGKWNFEIGSFALGAEPLRALCGDTTGAEAKTLQSIDKASTIALGVAGAVLAAPLVVAAGIELGPALLTAVQGSSVYMLALEHPFAAADLGLLAIGKTIQLVSTGEISFSWEDICVIAFHSANIYYASRVRVTSTDRDTVTITIKSDPVETTPGGGASQGTKGSSAPIEEHESGGTSSSGGKGSAPAVTDAETPSATQKPPSAAKAPVAAKAPIAASPEAEESIAAPRSKSKAAATSSPPKAKAPAAPAMSKPMRARPPGSPPRGPYASTLKTTKPSRPPNAEVTYRKSSVPSSSFEPDETTQGKLKAASDAEPSATEAHANLPRSKQQKTIASSAGAGTKPKMSGRAHLSEQGEEAKIAEIEAHAKKIGHILDPHARDAPGKPGSYLAVHAEKQAIVEHPNTPVAVTREMCPDCVSFFKREAAFQRQNQVVNDPAGKHVFEPSGAVTEYRTDGTVVRFEADGSVSVRPPEGTSK